MKRQKQQPQEVLRDFRDKDGEWKPIHRLPDGTKLEWVPTWEGVLQYAPIDLREDRPLRFWHVFYHKQLKRTVRVKLIGTVRHSSADNCVYRRIFKFIHKGKFVSMGASNLTELCKTGFAVADRRHWVVDHIDNNPMNDRPSNLRVISARENNLRSEAYRKALKRSNAENRKLRIERQSIIDKMREEIIATIGQDATRVDVEVELALRIKERGI